MSIIICKINYFRKLIYSTIKVGHKCVSENHLNGSGALVERQEDIVCSQMKVCGIINDSTGGNVP